MAKRGSAKTIIVYRNKKFFDAVDKMKRKPHVKVGVLQSSGGDKPYATEGEEKMTTAMVATFHEFGGENGLPPERSFIRSTVRKHFNKIQRMKAELLNDVLKGKRSPESALGVLGEFIKAMIQAEIRGGIEPALAQATVLRKGSSVPLIDTGQLLGAIAYEVVSKGSNT